MPARLPPRKGGVTHNPGLQAFYACQACCYLSWVSLRQGLVSQLNPLAPAGVIKRPDVRVLFWQDSCIVLWSHQYCVSERGSSVGVTWVPVGQNPSNSCLHYALRTEPWVESRGTACPLKSKCESIWSSAPTGARATVTRLSFILNLARHKLCFILNLARRGHLKKADGPSVSYFLGSRVDFLSSCAII